MAFLGQFRKIDMRLVFTYPLRPLPWALADPYGLLRKANKARLAQQLEKQVVIADSYPNDATSIYDGMVELQVFKPLPGDTFAVVADRLFAALTRSLSKRIDIVFEVYKDLSIKNVERSKRVTGPEGVICQNILPGFQVKNWSKILSVSANKAEVVRFLVGQWKEKQFREKLHDRTPYVTEEEKCWKIDFTTATLVQSSRATKKRPTLAWSYSILHAQHARGKCVTQMTQTSWCCFLPLPTSCMGKWYLQKGKGTKRRIVGISEVADKLGKQVAEGIPKQEAFEALIGLHALTRCDTVSAFSSKGKWRLVQMVKNQDYLKTMKDIGKESSVNEVMLRAAEEFVCQLYGKKCTSVDSLRYQLHCAKAGKVEPEALPPCQSSLRLHSSRANYQAAIWRRAAEACSNIPSPHRHAWKVNCSTLEFVWLGSRPAPDSDEEDDE